MERYARVSGGAAVPALRNPPRRCTVQMQGDIRKICPSTVEILQKGQNVNGKDAPSGQLADPKHESQHVGDIKNIFP